MPLVIKGSSLQRLWTFNTWSLKSTFLLLFFYERTNPTKGSQSKQQQQQLTVNNVLICAFIRVIFVLKNDEYEWLTFQF